MAKGERQAPEGTRIERKLILIDGRRLAELMIEHDIGVGTARAFTFKKLDLDYFDEDGC